MKYVVLCDSLGSRHKRGDVIEMKDLPEVGGHLEGQERDEFRAERFAMWESKKSLRKASAEESKYSKVHIDPNERPSHEEDIRMLNDRVKLLEKQISREKEKNMVLEQEAKRQMPAPKIEEQPQFKKLMAEKDFVISDLRKQIQDMKKQLSDKEPDKSKSEKK